MLNGKAVRLLFCRETKRYFQAWKLEFLLRRKKSCRYLTRLFHRSHLERVFATWSEFTYNSNRVLNAITRIQARVRGEKAREFAEDYRTDVIWAANKINAVVRRRLGKKELRRRKRMFRLKEYKNVRSVYVSLIYITRTLQTPTYTGTGTRMRTDGNRGSYVSSSTF